MNLFSANLVIYGDRSGLGAYETGHFLQHQQYATILSGQSVLLPDYDILLMGTGPEGDPQRFLGVNENQFLAWLQDHEALHQLLRAQANVTGDLSWLDPDSEEIWNLWQQQHAQEHAQFDAHFGTT